MAITRILRRRRSKQLSKTVAYRTGRWKGRPSDMFTVNGGVDVWAFLTVYFSIAGDSTCGQRVVYQLGLTGIPVFNVNNNCSTGSSALMLAKEFVEYGAADCVLSVGFEKMERGSLTSKVTVELIFLFIYILSDCSSWTERIQWINISKSWPISLILMLLRLQLNSLEMQLWNI